LNSGITPENPSRMGVFDGRKIYVSPKDKKQF